MEYKANPNNAFIDKLSFSRLTRPKIANALKFVLNSCIGKEKFKLFVLTQDENSSKWNILSGEPKLLESGDLVSIYSQKINFNLIIFKGNKSNKFVPLLVIVQCKTLNVKNDVAQIFKDISSLITFSLVQENNYRITSLNYKITKNTLTFPNGSDDIIAYAVLRYGKSISENWSKLSFWRFSRTKKSLQEIAKYYFIKRDHITFDSIISWNLPAKIKIWQNPFELEEVTSLPDLIYITKSESKFQVPNNLKSSFSFKDECIEINYENKQGYKVFLDCYYTRSTKYLFNEEDLKKRFEQFLFEQYLETNEYLLILSQNLSFNQPSRAQSRIDIHSYIFGPFQTLIILKGDVSSEINISKLAHLMDLQKLSSISIEQISQSRYNFRHLIQILKKIATITSEIELVKVIQNGIADLIGTHHFIILDSKKNKIENTSESLKKMHNEYLEHGYFYNESFTLSDCSKCKSDSVHKIINIIKAESNKHLEDYIANNEVKSKLSLIEEYDNIGMSFFRINGSYELIVFSYKYWKIRALEEIALRILCDAIDNYMTNLQNRKKPKIELNDAILNFVRFQGPVKKLGQELIEIIIDELKEVSIFLVAIDMNANFFEPISSFNLLKEEKVATLSFKKDHLIKECYQSKIQIKTSYNKESNKLLYKDKIITFQEIVKPNQYIYSFPLGYTNYYNPMAVLIVSTPQDIDNNKKILDLIELFSLGLNKRRSDIYNFSSSILTSYLVKLQKNRNFQPYRTHSDVNNLNNNQFNLPLLPSSLNRNYTLDYRNTICKMLTEIKEKTSIFSLTIRIKDDYCNRENDYLWLLANSIKSDPIHKIKYDLNKGIHSFLMNSRYKSIFIPDVNNKSLIQEIYPGCNYLGNRSNTVSELCIKIINENQRIHATLNIEDMNFENLWLYEDALNNLGNSIGRELIDDELYSYYGEKSLRKIFNIYLSQSRHNLINRISSINSEIEINKPNIYNEIGADLQLLQDFIEKEYIDLDNENDELVDISNVINEKVKQLNQDPQNVSVKIIFLDDNEKYLIKTPEIFSHLFYKLLFEQISTLKKIGDLDKCQLKLACSLRKEVYGIFIDLVNTAKVDSTTQNITSSLFWHRIDINRKGSGRTGLGLVLIGNMLRSIGIVPNAYPFLNEKLTAIYGKDYTGIWIELKIKNTNDEKN